MFLSSSVLFLAVVPAAFAIHRPDDTGKLPVLGWNSWYALGGGVSHDNVMTAANYVVSLGLRDLGYKYINVDDCWSDISGRDNTGRLLADTGRFPSGIAGLATDVHNLNLKLGIYSSAGDTTCAGYPASLGNEVIDAETFANWGVDYLKYDNCNYPQNLNDQYTFCVPDDQSDDNHFFVPNGTCPDNANAPPPGYDWSTSNTAARFRAMGDALSQQPHTIMYSLCEWGQAAVGSWAKDMSDSWRMSGDIHPTWERIFEILNENSFLMNNVDFYGHADADMLMLGIGNGLSLAEARTQFAFWAAMKSPLILSTDLGSLSGDLLYILTNQHLLGFNQDATFGKPAMPFKWGYNPNWTFDPRHPAEYWMGQSEQGLLVLMMNTDDVTATRSVTWSELNLGGTPCGYQVIEVWGKHIEGCYKDGLSCDLESHDTCVYLVGSACYSGC